MGLRETIAYNNDLLTNTLIAVKKYKDSAAVMINIATVQLFDEATGKLIYEAKAENLINNIVSKLAYMDYYYWRILGNVAPNTAKYADPFQTLLLTDYAGVEDASLTLAKGTIIGYADKSTAYAGTSTVAGTINLAETKLDIANDGLLHFVFDFPTNAANGTFQTIWWTAYSINQIVNLATVTPSNWAILIAHNNGIISDYSLAAGSYFWNYNFELTAANKIYPIGVPAIGGSTCIGGECDGSNTYIVDLVSTQRAISKFSADMSAFISKVNIPSGLNSLYGDMIDLAECNGTLYALTTKLFIVPLNPTTGIFGTGIDIKAKVGYPTGATCLYGGLSSNGVDKFFFGCSYNLATSRGIWTLDINYNVQEFRKIASDFVVKLTYHRKSDTLYYVTYASYTYLYKTKFELTSPGAQNLLAAPITKNNTQTMKIQYDFNVQKVL